MVGWTSQALLPILGRSAVLSANTIPYDLMAAGGSLVQQALVPLLLKVRMQLVQGFMAGAVE